MSSAEYFIEFSKRNQHNTYTSDTKLYALTNKWFALFKLAFKDPNIKIEEEIKNSWLIENGRLKQNLIIPQDYVLITEEANRYLQEKFKPDTNFCVRVAFDPTVNKYVPCIEMATIVVYYRDSKYETVFSILETFSALKTQACEYFNLLPKNTRLIDYWNKHRRDYVDESMIIKSRTKLKKQTYLLEPEKQYNDYNAFKVSSPQPGMIGLKNLCQTCYFNSVIQCLAQTTPVLDIYLNKYPISDACKNSKYENLARDFANILHQIWNGANSPIVPTELFNSFSSLATAFSKIKQNDAQECLTYLLDLLIISSDKEQRQEFTEGETPEEYEAKHDSPILKTFSGFNKISRICTVCHHEQTKFDLVRTILLPIPEQTETLMYFIVIPKLKNPEELEEEEEEEEIVFPYLYLLKCNSDEDLQKQLDDKFPSDKYIFFNYDNQTFEKPTQKQHARYYAFEHGETEYIYNIVYLRENSRILGLPYLIGLTDDTEDMDGAEFICKTSFGSLWTEEMEEMKADITTEKKYKTKYENVSGTVFYADLDTSQTNKMSGFKREMAEFTVEFPEVSSSINIYDCFYNFIRTSDENLSVMCDNCKKTLPITSTTTFYKLPKILVLQLSRFIGNGSSNQRNNTRVDFFDEIDLRKFMAEGAPKQSTKYRLYAIIHHWGNTNMSGHNWATCRIKDRKDTWVEFSDDLFIEIKKGSDHDNTAYILFYEQIPE